MPDLSVDELLLPLGDDAPSGPDLVYDPAFLALDHAAKGRPEQEFGDFKRPAEPPPWPEILEQALALSQRTRDLRLAVLLTRAAARTSGLVGCADGLRLVAGLLDAHWGSVHPALDASDGDDPTERLNALSPLLHPAAGLADLRSASIGRPAAGLTVRLLELAWTKADAHADETRPTPQGVLDGLRDAVQVDARVVPALLSIHDSFDRLKRTLDTRAPQSMLSLEPLRPLASACLTAAQAVVPEPAATEVMPDAPVANPATPAVAGRASLAPQSRDDVVRLLDTACRWIEQHEPSSPAPLLIRRAQRLMSKSFVDLVRDLAPGGLGELERIAGLESS